MTSMHWLTTIALATALVGTTALARPDQTNMHSAKHMRAKAALRVVPNRSQPTQAAYGWKYFTNPRAPHAVMISPSGEYFLSLGDGPRQITGPAGQLLPNAPAQG